MSKCAWTSRSVVCIQGTHMTDRTTAKNVAIFGDHEANTLAQLYDVASRAERAALMADGHVGYVMPIGGVAAYREQVSVVGVGFDIACGNAAIRTNLHARRHSGPARAAAGARRRDPGRRVVRRRPQEPRRRCAGRTTRCSTSERGMRCPGTHGRAARARRARSSAPSAAAITTSTCSPTRRVASGSACTSAAAGSATPSRPASSRCRRTRSGASACPSARCCSGSTRRSARTYWALMKLAGEYAYAGREWVARKVVSMLGARGGGAGAQPPQLRVARRRTTAAKWSSSARARRRRSPASRGSSADRWATTR